MDHSVCFIYCFFFLSKVDDLFYLKFRMTSEWNDPRLRYIQRTYYIYIIYKYQEGSSISRQTLNEYIGTFHLARTQLYHLPGSHRRTGFLRNHPFVLVSLSTYYKGVTMRGFFSKFSTKVYWFIMMIENKILKERNPLLKSASGYHFFRLISKGQKWTSRFWKVSKTKRCLNVS